MLELILGIVAAVGAAVLYSLGFSYQALEAREAPRSEQLRPALALRLLKRVRWLGGTGLSMLGWPLQLLALSLAPLVVVQPALALGLPVLMVMGERMLGERAGRREHLAVGAIVVGVIGAGVFAPPRSDHARALDRARDRAGGAGAGEPAAVPAAAPRPPTAVRDDAWRGAGVRLERRGHQAGVGRPRERLHRRGDRLGPGHREARRRSRRSAR